MTNKIWTFNDMLKQSVLMSKALHSAGVRQNDVITIIAENRHEYPAISFGAFYLNAIVAPMNVTYTESKSLISWFTTVSIEIVIRRFEWLLNEKSLLIRKFSLLGELKHALDLSKPKLVFCSPYAAKTTLKVCRSLKYVQNVILIEGRKIDDFVISLDDFKKLAEKSNFNVEENVARKVDIKDQVSLIVCSSGTTGMPKGVMITQENIMSVVQGYRDLFVLTKMIYGETLRILNIAPWFHALGFLSMFMIACSRDAIYVFLPKFEERAFLGSIEVSLSVWISVSLNNFNFL